MTNGWSVNGAMAGAPDPGDAEAAPRRWLAGPTARLAAVGTALLLVVFLVLGTSRAAFTATTENSGNSVAAGTVVLTDDDSGTAMFNSVSNLAPGVAEERCIHVDYTGSLDTDPIALYASGAPGGDLAPYLDLKIEMGADNGDAFPTCTNFTASQTLFDGTLATFGSTHTDYASGVETWSASNGTSRTFRVTVEVQDDPAAAGKSASWGFTWEARSA